MNLTESPSLLPFNPPVEQISFEPLPKKPLVSIIVPSYNQGRFIGDTIESILKQDYRPIKIHVIDGASTDETVEVLKSFHDHPELQWISEPDRGVVHAVNKGFAQVKGDLIAIQSSDDMYLPGAISQVVERFQSESQLGLLYGDTVKVDAQGKELSKYQIGPYSLENLFLFKSWIPQPSAFFRKEMLDLCGGWDEKIPYAPDTDLWIRMAFRTKVEKLNAYLSQRRMHEAQRDTQAHKIVRDFTQMLDQSHEIPQSNESIQSAARAARHLIRVRYNPSGSDWYAAWHLFRAGQKDARVANLKAVFGHFMLPVYRKLSVLKQLLKGRSVQNSTSH